MHITSPPLASKASSASRRILVATLSLLAVVAGILSSPVAYAQNAPAPASDGMPELPGEPAQAQGNFEFPEDALSEGTFMDRAQEVDDNMNDMKWQEVTIEGHLYPIAYYSPAARVVGYDMLSPGIPLPGEPGDENIQTPRASSGIIGFAPTSDGVDPAAVMSLSSAQAARVFWLGTMYGQSTDLVQIAAVNQAFARIATDESLAEVGCDGNENSLPCLPPPGYFERYEIQGPHADEVNTLTQTYLDSVDGMADYFNITGTLKPEVTLSPGSWEGKLSGFAVYVMCDSDWCESLGTYEQSDNATWSVIGGISVDLTIEGPAVWKENGEKTISLTTPDEGDLEAEFVATGKGEIGVRVEASTPPQAHSTLLNISAYNKARILLPTPERPVHETPPEPVSGPAPTVTTKAVEEVVEGEVAMDVAMVSGAVPEGSELTWDYYITPRTSPTAECTAPEEDTVESLLEAGPAGTVGPVAVDSAGEYTSPEVSTKGLGNSCIWWVELLTSPIAPSEGDDPVPTVVAEGYIGNPDELTRVSREDLTVTTKAGAMQDEPRRGDGIWDTVKISNPDAIHEGDHTVVSGYIHEDGQPICDASTLAWTSERIELVPGVDEYQTDTWVTQTVGTHSFIERTYDSDDNLLSEGVCGEPDETIEVLDIDINVSTILKHDGDEEEGPVVGDNIWDEVTIEGDIKDGDYTVVDLFVWEDEDNPVCTEPVWTSETIDLVPGETVYETGKYLTEDAGVHGFIETTYDADGEIISRGECGDPDETITVIHGGGGDAGADGGNEGAGEQQAGAGGAGLASTGANVGVLVAIAGVLAVVGAGALVRRKING